MQCARKLLNMMTAMRQLAAGLLCGLMLFFVAVIRIGERWECISMKALD